MDSIVEQMNKWLAESYVLYLKAHTFHWNVEDPLFPLWHDFFGDFYEDIYGQVDRIAEEVRALDGIPVSAFARMLPMSSIKEAGEGIAPVSVMLVQLSEDNTKITSTLNQAFNLATQANQQGLANYIAERIDAHRKHAWKFRAILKKAGVKVESVQQDENAEDLSESRTYEIVFNK